MTSRNNSTLDWATGVAVFVIVLLLIASLYSCGMANFASNDYQACIEVGRPPAECAENSR